jgi:hypothetical protein
MSQLKKRQYKYTPRGKNSYRALKLIGLLGFATVRQLCLTVWGNERTTNDNINRLLDNAYLHQAHEPMRLSQGRGNRILFLTKTGMTWVLKQGHVREDDIAYYWRGEGDWQPSYSEHNVAVHDVLCAFIKRAHDHPDKAIDIRLDPHAPLGREEQTDFRTPLQDSKLIPDRIFAVRYADQVAEFYLEVDLGTEGKRQWREKMEKYLVSPEVMHQEGVFVLVVVNSERRVETLLNWSSDLVDDRFRFSPLDRVCYTYERGVKELVLTQEGDPFGQVWRVTKDDEERTLIDDWHAIW